VSIGSNHIDESRWTGLSEVFRLAMPAILASISWTVMQFVDTAMVGQLGQVPLAAVGSAGLWSFVMNTFAVGVVGCVATFVGQSLGRGRLVDCGRYAWQGIYLSLATGVVGLALWPLASPIFNLMPHTPDVTQQEILYFRVRLFGYVFIAWQTALASFFQAINRPMIPMVSAFAANLANIVLDYGLIFGNFGLPRMEIAGAALATVISLAFQVVILQWLFLSKPMEQTYATRSGFAFNWRKTSELFNIGWPAGLSFLLDVTNWGIFTSFIVGYFGDSVLAAHTAAIAIMHISFVPAMGLNQAIAPIVGQWIGRENIPIAKARAYTGTKLGIMYMFGMGVIFAFLGPSIIRAFFIDDPNVVKLCHVFLMMGAVFQGFDAINIVLSGALRGAGDTRWIAVMTAIGAYCIFLPSALVMAFVFRWGAIGAWLGATVYIIALSGIMFRRFHGERWRYIKIFRADLIPAVKAPDPLK
jgi:MATE family multidrug resistance protein